MADASLPEKCRCSVAYRTRVEYSTAKPRVANVWTKNSAPVPSGIFASLLFRYDKALSRQSGNRTRACARRRPSLLLQERMVLGQLLGVPEGELVSEGLFGDLVFRQRLDHLVVD